MHKTTIRSAINWKNITCKAKKIVLLHSNTHRITGWTKLKFWSKHWTLVRTGMCFQVKHCGKEVSSGSRHWTCIFSMTTEADWLRRTCTAWSSPRAHPIFIFRSWLASSSDFQNSCAKDCYLNLTRWSKPFSCCIARKLMYARPALECCHQNWTRPGCLTSNLIRFQHATSIHVQLDVMSRPSKCARYDRKWAPWWITGYVHEKFTFLRDSK